jgi:hypothetical protein
MADNDIPAGQQQEAPAETPAPLTPEQIAEVVTKAIDARIPGLQSGYDKRINELETQVRQSNMDEDEIEAEATQNLRAQLAAEQAKSAGLIAAQKYPDAFPVWDKLNAAESAEDQLKTISDLLAAAAPAAPPSDEGAPAEPPPPAVDPNNPRTDQALDANGMDAEKASRIIGAFGNVWPGRE